MDGGTSKVYVSMASMSEPKKSQEALEIERRYRYRTMILKRQVKLPRDAATKMVGPDCAYHLYRSHKGT